MIVKCFSVYDSKVNAYLQPFFMQSRGAAIRGFTEVVNDASSVIGKYPEDHTLFELGEFDDASGQFTCHLTPVSIGVGVEFIKS